MENSQEKDIDFTFNSNTLEKAFLEIDQLHNNRQNNQDKATSKLILDNLYSS